MAQTSFIAVYDALSRRPLGGGGGGAATPAGSMLYFSPDTQGATIILESLVGDGVTFDIKVTHPVHVQPTPRDGTVRTSLNGRLQEEVHIKLVALSSLDTAALSATPMRIMISATRSDPVGVQKMKLVCDYDSVLECIAHYKLADKVASKSSSRSSTPTPGPPASSESLVGSSVAHADPNTSLDASVSGLPFCISMTLRELRVPPPPRGYEWFAQQDEMCCIQWKRGASSGHTPWCPVEVRDDGSAVCAFNDASIVVPQCEVSLEKRVILSLGLISTDLRRSPSSGASIPRGTLKLDASRPMEVAAGDTAFPITIDGISGASLVAALNMTTQAEPPAATTPPPQMLQPPSSHSTTPLSSTTTGPPAAPLGRKVSTVDSSNILTTVRTHLETLGSTLRSGVPPLSPSAGVSSPSAAADASPLNPLSASMKLATPLSSTSGENSTNPLRSFERQMPKSSNVQVAVRIRPRLAFEAPYNEDEAWSHTDSAIKAVSNDRQYQFDYVFPPTVSTRAVFDTLCPSLIENTLFGVNGTIFMYGQTASGKTHTMFGSEQEMGITPLAIGALFREIENNRKDHRDMEATVHASYFEIYNEELNDLLDLSKKNLQVRASSDGFTVDVTSIHVRTLDEAMQVLIHGSYNKKMGQSHLNDRSSRSHSIFKIAVEVSGIQLEGESGNGNAKGQRSKTQKTTAELCLVDLAGSETLQEKSGTSQRKETTNINLSLTYLKKVIWELAHKERHVSYRNSTLTKVLKQAVGGNSRTCVVCCITAAPEHFRDSRNTLNFGTTAKSVVTTTKVNTTGPSDSAEVKRLQAEVQRLHTIIEAYESTVQAYIVMEDDFRNVLEENGVMGAQIEALEAEKVAMIEEKHSSMRSASNVSGVSVAGGAATTGDHAEDEAAPAPVAPKRFAMPSAVLRANAEEHAALLEEAISRLNEVAVSEPGGDAGTRTPTDDAGVEERLLDEDDMFDEVDEDENGAVIPAKRSRPSAPKVRPPPTRNRVSGVASRAPITAPRSIESLQLQLIQQTIDHRQELLRKDQEIERVQALQVRPSDEIPEIMKKEEKVCVLLDQLHSFLHHGTPMRIIYTGDTQMSSTVDVQWSGANLPRSAPRIARVFMYLYTYHQKETFLCFCLIDAEGKQPKRSSCFEKILVKDIKRIELGQYSDSFQKLKAWSASNPPLPMSSTTADPTNQSGDSHRELCKNTLDRRRMSFTIVAKKGKQFECICEDEADFEAWVIELNRLLGTSAEWKSPLDISHMQFYEVLDDAEKQFCASMHIHPDEYIRAKNKMLRRKEKFVTLFDVRALAQFDLYHSQRFFYFLRCQGWVSQAALFYLTDKFVASAQPNLDEL